MLRYALRFAEVIYLSQVELVDDPFSIDLDTGIGVRYNC